MNTFVRKFIAAGLVVLSLSASAATRYVDLNSPSPTPPYTSWSTAATNIQDAIDVASDGDMVLVTNGIYRAGGRVVFGAMTNRIAVTKPLVVQSVNGPSQTSIEGNGPPGAGAVRCVYLTNQAQLIGFTLTNGATLASGDPTKERSGGGIWCERPAGPVSFAPVISNCVITANVASQDGGGACNGRYVRCVFKDNAASYGGAASRGYFQSCLILGNTAHSGAGGLESPDSAYNSTIVSNSCAGSGGAGGVRAGGEDLQNCIIYYNTNTNPTGLFQNFLGFSSQLINCNTITIPPGSSGTTITNPPLFVNSASGDFRLQSNSACINAGKNANIVDDLDLNGLPRIVSGTVDIGAYEFQSSASMLSYEWAQRYGFPTDGTADFSDGDGDGMSNYGEWRSDTVPTNVLSVLRIVGITNTTSGIRVTWNCVSSRNYYMERATNLAFGSPFQNINNFVPGGSSPTRNYVDTTATNGGPYFYRVGVQ
jgi:hypothetical protein